MSTNAVKYLLFFHTLFASILANDASPSCIKSAFVPSAAPQIVSQNDKNSPSQILAKRLMTGYGVFPSFEHLPKEATSQFKATALFAKSKRGGASSKGGKVQVKLLENILGTGVVGEVIMVSPAFFENKLKKTKSAVLITDDEVAEMNNKKKVKEESCLETANDMKEHLTGYELALKRKAGPEGHLFGGIGKKCIMQELKKSFPKGSLDGKEVKVTKIKDGETEKELKHDIKEIGAFTATIKLYKDISANVAITVTAE